MALINCPKCNGLCTDSAQFCSTCDFNFTKYRIDLAQGSKVCLKCSTVNSVLYPACLKCGGSLADTVEPIKTEQPTVATPPIAVQQIRVETPISKEQPKAEIPPVPKIEPIQQPKPETPKVSKEPRNKAKIGLIIGGVIAVVACVGLFKFMGNKPSEESIRLLNGYGGVVKGNVETIIEKFHVEQAAQWEAHDETNIYKYDDKNRLAEVLYNGTTKNTFQYDKNGNVVEIKMYGGKQGAGYNSLSHLTERHVYHYNNAGKIIADSSWIDYGTGELEYQEKDTTDYSRFGFEVSKPKYDNYGFDTERWGNIKYEDIDDKGNWHKMIVNGGSPYTRHISYRGDKNESVTEAPKSNDTRIEESNSDSDALTLKEVKLTLLDAGQSKCETLLGEHDVRDMLAETKLVQIYNNKVSDNGVMKHLVLCIRMVRPNAQTLDVRNRVEEIYAVTDEQKAYYGIHYVVRRNGQWKSNSSWFDMK